MFILFVLWLWFETINYNMQDIYTCATNVLNVNQRWLPYFIVGSPVGCPLNCLLFPCLKVVGCPLSCPLFPYMEVGSSRICMAKFPWAAHSAAHWAAHFLCRLRSLATHRDHFVRRLSVRPSVRLSVCLSFTCFAGDTCIPRNAATIFNIWKQWDSYWAAHCFHIWK